MNKTIHFISGLPRSGSTLLCNLLNQNPEFGVTGTSGILGVVAQIRNTWNMSSELLASATDEQKMNVMKGALQGYFKDFEQEIVFDKSRGWTGYIEMAEKLIGDVKIVACVRDLTDILASFEKVYRKNSGTNIFPQEKQFPVEWLTVEGRTGVMVRGDQPVGSAWSRLKDALQRGHENKIHLVEFVDLTTDPEGTLKKIYEFLAKPYYKGHDFNKVEQTIFENDLFHGMGKDLHTIKSKVKPVVSDARKVLGEETFRKFSNQEFWR